MNGISVMIDTNIAIALLNGEKKPAEMLDGKVNFKNSSSFTRF
jgi:hypothetical protein